MKPRGADHRSQFSLVSRRRRRLIHQQSVPYPAPGHNSHVITVRPCTDQRPFGRNGTETPANFNFFYLAKVKDPAATGDTMYEIWYGESDQAHASPPGYTEHAKLAWLAVPPGDQVARGDDTAVALTRPGSGPVTVYGDPISSSSYGLGTAPSGPVFASGGTLREDFNQPRPGRLWYEINFNHRQAYVPASSVTVVHAAAH